MNLIKMTDFVLELGKKTRETGLINLNVCFIKTEGYAIFLKQPLELWMFVPCDKDGNVLVEPDYKSNETELENEWLEYQQAKERCLFEGFEIKERSCNEAKFKYVENGLLAVYYFNTTLNKFMPNTDYKTIEDLVKYNLQLTKTAIKQLGL